MDKHGYFNFGLSASDIAAVIEVSEKVVVEVNPLMPVVLGGTEVSVHIDDVDFIVENEGIPMADLPSGVPSEIDEAVASSLFRKSRMVPACSSELAVCRTLLVP